MSVIKEIIKFNNLDVNLKFTLGANDGFLGYQQEIDNLVVATKEILINPVNDTEVRRFKYDSSIGRAKIIFYFGNSHTNTFISAGFTEDEINTNDAKLLNSFFILDFYDTYNSNTQSKIFTNYLTKILGSNDNTPHYRIFTDTVNQFYNWNIPLSYINAQTGTTVIGYTKFSFYNAKTGVIALFYNYNNDEILTPFLKMYFKTELNLSNMTWKFLGLTDAVANPFQVDSTSAYANRVNNTIGNFENKKQVYPTGNTFQSTDGTYSNE